MLVKRVALLSLLVMFGACKSKPAAELVAKVNGEGITKQEFDQEVERNLARYRGQARELPPGIEDRIKESVLRRLIDDKMIAQKAKSIGVQVSEEELNAKMDEHKKRFRTDEAFKAYLERSNNTEANIRSDLERNLLRDRVVEKLSGTVEITPEDISKYYTENEARFKEKEQVKASRVLVRVEENAKDAEKKALLKQAKDLRAKLAKGGDFAAIATKDSKGPEAARGGDLGWFSRGRFPPEFDDAVFKLQANGVSDVITTKLGYEIVKVFEKKPERQRPMEEVQDNIKQSLDARMKNQKRRDVLRNLKSEAQVEQLVQFEKPQMAAPAPGAMPGAPGAAPQAMGEGAQPSEGAATAAPAAPSAPTPQ